MDELKRRFSEHIIMIVDDEIMVRETTINILNVMGIHNIQIATNGQEAIKILEDITSKLPDLILLDIMMPGMNGFQFTEYIKKINVIKDIPVLFVSSCFTQNDLDRVIKSGGIGLVPKPFDMNTLISKICKCFDCE